MPICFSFTQKASIITAHRWRIYSSILKEQEWCPITTTSSYCCNGLCCYKVEKIWYAPPVVTYSFFTLPNRQRLAETLPTWLVEKPWIRTLTNAGLLRRRFETTTTK